MKIEFTIPVATPLLNAWQRLHWQARRRLTKRLCHEVALVTREHRAATVAPLQRARVTIYRHSSRAPDHDGLVGGVKPLIDCLVPVSRRHPHGLGLIADDAPDVLVELVVEHVQCKRADARTVVVIEEVE